MAEFLHESTFNHKGNLVGGMSLTDEELDGLNLNNVEFSDQRIDTNDLVEEFSEGTLFKLELDIDENELPDVDDRIYEHTYDDVETQLNQIFKYRRKHHGPNHNWNRWTNRSPIEENCIIAILKEVNSEKVIFKLYGVEGTVTIRPHQFKAIYPCYDRQLSVQFDLYEEVLAHTI